MREKAKILDKDTIKRSLMRIAHEILEKNKGIEDLCLIGIRNRGAYLAKRLADYISGIEKLEKQELARASAKDYLRAVEARLSEQGITVRSEVKTAGVGAIAEEIIKLSDEIEADVVAMSTHGRSGVSRWAFGSVTGEVLHAGNTPILLVRAPALSWPGELEQKQADDALKSGIA